MFKTNVIKFKGLKLVLLLVTATALLPSREARSGLFDWKPFSRKPATSQKPTASQKAPENSNPIRQVSDSVPVAEPQDSAPLAQPGEIGVVHPAMTYYESDCPVPAMKMCREKTFDCFNCGEDDRLRCCERHTRKKCDQTWYPRVAPYCAAGWGYTQPCWRRTQDNYNCPPQTQPRSSAPPRADEPPVVEPMPEDDPAIEKNPVSEGPPRRRDSASRR